jgi:formylglycine-generating enzyme required for sulfatase activity
VEDAPKMRQPVGGSSVSIVLAVAAATAALSWADRRAAIAGSGLAEFMTPAPEHAWTLHDGKHWQIVSQASEYQSVTDGIERNRGACGRGMVEVRGRMKLDTVPRMIETMQKLVCTRWVTEEFPERCAEFDEERWLRYIAPIATTEMAFCIDRHEYPNVKGQFPWVFVGWTEAADICANLGKRLCSDEEWTFACEGEDAWPYPYGFARSSEACVIDRSRRSYDQRAFADRSSRIALLELDRVWHGEASGSQARCRSPFGVYDMTGNVDEWTQATTSHGYRPILKGGYWAEVRNRCRGSTRVHRAGFAFYQQGFRCCTDLPKR